MVYFERGRTVSQTFPGVAENSTVPARGPMDDDFCAVGLPISLETCFRDKYDTRLVGWEKDLYVITSAVFSDGRPAWVCGDEPCRMRFLKDGVAYGFETRIISVHYYPYPVMFLKYPVSVERIAIRKHPRIESNIPARALNANGGLVADGAIADISEGGAVCMYPSERTGPRSAGISIL